MKKYQLFLLSLASGVLLWLSWYPYGFSLLSLIAFVPLFMISDELLQKKGKMVLWQGLLYSFPAFFIWNIATTWWIWNSTPPGAVAAMFLNALFMSVVFGLWHCFKRQQPSIIAIPLTFIAFWCSFEFLHLHWDISWPWLNLGNVFAPNTKLIQWYEYTGTFGGTIWILLTNFFFYYAIKYFKENKRKFIIAISCAVGALIIPIAISLIIYSTYKPSTQEPIEAIIVQQNTDPWEEQYRMNNLQHTIRLLQTAYPLIDEKTELIVCSESAIPHTVYGKALLMGKSTEDNYSYYQGFVLLDTFIKEHPNLNFIFGLSTFDAFDTKVRATARDRGDGIFVELYNTSACMNRNGITDLYHKSKLVPGVELMPYPALFGFLEKLVIDLGGPSGSLGIDSTQHAFSTTINNGNIKVGAPVCYESIYGEHFAKFVNDGAQLMSVITNDSWWEETPGHRQHFIYSKLRAVESRRTIMRAANTGISAFIDEKGDVHQQTKYNERLAIKQAVRPHDKITFYVKHGDYLARIALGISAIMLLYGLYQWLLRKLGYQR